MIFPARLLVVFFPKEQRICMTFVKGLSWYHSGAMSDAVFQQGGQTENENVTGCSPDDPTVMGLHLT